MEELKQQPGINTTANLQEVRQQPGINVTANLYTGDEVRASDSKINGVLRGFGDQLLSQSSAELGQERALQDINDQQKLMAEGADGKFNHVSNVLAILNPKYAQNYDNVIDQTAVPVNSARVNAAISSLAQSIKINPNIPIDQKQQVFAQSIAAGMPKYMESVPDDIKATVNKLAYAQSSQELQGIVRFSARIQASQNEVTALDSMETLADLGRKSDSIVDANNYMAQIKSITDAGISTGTLTPEESRRINDQYKNDILGHFAVNHNIFDVKKWNFENGSPLDDKTVDSVQSFTMQQYAREESRREQEQLQNGYSFELQIAKAMNGYAPTSPEGGYTDREWAAMQRAQFLFGLKRDETTSAMDDFKDMGNIINGLKDMGAEDRFNLLAGNFDKLNDKYKPFIPLFLQRGKPEQSFILKEVSAHNENIKNEPYNSLDELSKPDLDAQLKFKLQHPNDPIPTQMLMDWQNNQSVLAQRIGVDSVANKIASPDHIKKIIEVARQHPLIADEMITGNWAPYATNVRAKVTKALPEEAAGYPMFSLPGTSGLLRKAYLTAAPDANLKNNKWITPTELNHFVGTSYYSALKDTDPETLQDVRTFVNRVVSGSGNTIRPYDVMSSMFDTNGGRLIAKGDDQYLNSKQFRDKAAEKGISTSEAFRYYPRSDSYRATTDKGHPVFITRQELQRMNPDSGFIFKNTANAAAKVAPYLPGSPIAPEKFIKRAIDQFKDTNKTEPK